MQLTNEAAIDLVRQGAEALQAGRAADARRHLEQVTATGRANAQIWLMLAMACNTDKDDAAEEQAVNALLALDPNLLRARIMKGDCRARAGDEQGSLSFYETTLRLAETQGAPDDLLPELRRIETMIGEAQARIADRREATLAARGVAPAGRSARFHESLEIMAGRKHIFVQSPTAYFFPGLPHVQFFDPAGFDWVSAIEAAAPAIRDELEAVLRDGLDGFRPYLTADPNRARIDDSTMLDNRDWSALFLCENGKVSDEFVARCPQTWAAMQAAPLPRIANSPTVMFSLLRPGARIAPHTGMFNTRLICHLPLIVPPGCGFRVGNETRQWQEGRVMIFDDTIEHEAWNDSNQDRVVLIFDIWRPELSDQERHEVAMLFESSLAL